MKFTDVRYEFHMNFILEFTRKFSIVLILTSLRFNICYRSNCTILNVVANVYI